MSGSPKRRATASRSCCTIYARPEQPPISNSQRRYLPMTSRHGLGRGLGALLPPTPDSAITAMELPIDAIMPNPQQPRKDFNDNSLRDLAASLGQTGVLQPVVVRRVGQGYQLIVGERRWRAAKLAGLTRIPAVVRDATDAQSLELALVENLLREDLNPMEEAEAYEKLLGQFGWTQEELAGRIGRDRSSIANALRLLRLPEEIQADLRGGRLTMGHALVLLSLTSEADQLRLRDEILAHSWTVRAAEQSARAVEAARGSERLGTIEVAYANADELERLAELLGARA